jgi:hypothetical protein
MSQLVQIFLVPIDVAELAEITDDWHSAIPILDKRFGAPSAHGMRTAASRNGWHVHALRLISSHIGEGGLGFVNWRIACLREADLDSAGSALDKVLATVSSGIPNLGDEQEKNGTIWWLRRYIDKQRKTRKFSDAAFRRAFAQAQPAHEIWSKDIGFEALVDFYSFIKSFRAAIAECLNKSKHLLYVVPGPDNLSL